LSARRRTESISTARAVPRKATAPFLDRLDLRTFKDTLVPFGFQNEKRTLHRARNTYIKVSPLFFADQFRDPLLLIHGKLYEAMRGTGRLGCRQPFETCGCAGLGGVTAGRATGDCRGAEACATVAGAR
jgi:hypothetical protein